MEEPWEEPMEEPVEEPVEEPIDDPSAELTEIVGIHIEDKMTELAYLQFPSFARFGKNILRSCEYGELGNSPIVPGAYDSLYWHTLGDFLNFCSRCVVCQYFKNVVNYDFGSSRCM